MWRGARQHHTCMSRRLPRITNTYSFILCLENDACLLGWDKCWRDVRVSRTARCPPLLPRTAHSALSRRHKRHTHAPPRLPTTPAGGCGARLLQTGVTYPFRRWRRRWQRQQNAVGVFEIQGGHRATWTFCSIPLGRRRSGELCMCSYGAELHAAARCRIAPHAPCTPHAAHTHRSCFMATCPSRLHACLSPRHDSACHTMPLCRHTHAFSVPSPNISVSMSNTSTFLDIVHCIPLSLCEGRKKENQRPSRLSHCVALRAAACVDIPQSHLSCHYASRRTTAATASLSGAYAI